jgi:hypothetical protein
MSDLISDAIRETVLQEFSQSPEKRRALVHSTFDIAQALIDSASRPSADPAKSLTTVNDLANDMLRVKTVLKGDEKADMTRFLGLLSEIQSLRDRLMARVRP